MATEAPFMPVVSGPEIHFPRLIGDAFAETGSIEGETGSTLRPHNHSICTPMPMAERRGAERVRMKEAEA